MQLPGLGGGYAEDLTLCQTCTHEQVDTFTLIQKKAWGEKIVRPKLGMVAQPVIPTAGQ